METHVVCCANLEFSSRVGRVGGVNVQELGDTACSVRFDALVFMEHERRPDEILSDSGKRGQIDILRFGFGDRA